MTQTKTGKNAADAELTGAVDPFAVDFFGPSNPGDHEEAASNETTRTPRRPRRDRPNWYRTLPRLTNRQAEMSNLLRFLPADFEALATGAASAELSKHLFRDAVSIELISSAETGVQAALSGKTSRPRVFLTGSEMESSSRFAGFFDVELGNRFIDLVLDGPKDDYAARRYLSETEQVIIEYLAARILSAINLDVGGRRLSIDSVSDSAPTGFDESERGLEMVFRVKLESYENIVTLIIPSGLLEKLTNSSGPGDFSAERFEKIVADSEVRVVIGSSTLDGASVASLEPEDIVLFDRVFITSDGSPAGPGPSIFVGRGNGFRLRGTIGDNGFNGKWLLQLEDIISEPSSRVFSPAKFIMENEEEIRAEVEPGTDDAVETEGGDLSPALENIQVGLRVEIAGSRVSLREIQELRAGQIIALGCGPNDPVRLAVDGSSDPVASGELVEIEGQLGIRLTKVFV